MVTAGKNHLLASVGIRPEESTLARWMTVLFAVIQASHGIGANTADALFFLRYGVDDLPLMILLSGPAVMIALIAHSAGLAVSGSRRWLVVIMGGSTLWVVLLWGGVLFGTDAVYPVIWISTQVLIFLTLTVMWNAAGSACNTRQAKRLFPVFATAAVAGGVLGNLAVGPLAAMLGTQNLLLVQSALLLISTVVIRRVVRFVSEDGVVHVSVRADMGRAVSAIRSSRLLKLAAVVVFLLFALFFLVLFPFSEAVVDEFTTEAGIAGFLGLFSSLATAATFLTSLLLTGRMFSRLGLVVSLSIVPLVYLLGFSVWLIGFGLLTATIVRGLQWVAVNSVQGTAYSALFNVVDPSRRGPVMALMTAVPAQLGTMTAGVILLTAEGRWSPNQLFFVGLVMATLAVAAVAAMRPAYVAAVVAAVRRGLVGLWDAPVAGVINPVDRDVMQVLVSHLADPRPRARAIAATGLGRMGDGSAAARVQRLLDDEDPMVRAAAFESLCQIEPDVVDAHLAGALVDPSAEVRLSAIHYMAAEDRRGFGISDLASVLEDADPRVRAAAAWLVSGEVGESVVRRMLSGADVDSLRAVFAEQARNPGRRLGVDPESYLDHDDGGVRAAAADAFVSLGGSLPRIVGCLDDPSIRVRRTAATRLASTAEGRRLLVEVLHDGSVLATEASIRALTPFEEPEARFTEWAANEAARAAYLSGHRAVLDGSLESKHGRFLVRVLGSRVDRLIQWVLLGMTTAKTREVMPIVARGVRASDAETNAQAVEALESIGERSVLTVLLPLLEPVGSEHVAHPVRESLEELADDFDPWLSALAARSLQTETSVNAAPGSPYARASGMASLESMAEERVDTLDDMGRVLVLQRVPMFSALDPEDLLLVARSTTETAFAEGEIVYREGDAGTELLVIVDGSAVVSRARDGVRHIIDTYGIGDFVGELSLLIEGERSADVHAGEHGLHGLVVEKAELIAVLEERPAVALGMLGTLAARLIEQT